MIARFLGVPLMRPIGLVILVVLAGTAAAWRLPVALYPPLVLPTVQVTARYPGASAETLANTVALPIEQRVNGVPDMLSMQSESAAGGSYTLNVTFARGTDVDLAQAQVQKRVASLLAALPGPVQAQGVVVQPKSPDGLMVVALSSPQKDPDSTDAGVIGELARLPGVVAQADNQSFTLDGQPAAGIAISQVPGANALAVSEAVRTKMAELAKAFPPGVTYGVPFDTTRFTRAAINAVYRNLFEAAILVLAVIVVFSQDWRATVVAGIGVAVTIMGAFAALAAMGFWVTVPSVIAIILAIGLVADDALVGVPGGSAMVAVAVFIPAAFLPGLAGEFIAPCALVMAATVLIGAVIVATLRPLQGRAPRRSKGQAAIRHFLVEKYLRLVRQMLRRTGLVALAALMLGGFAIWGLVQIPRGFLPAEDPRSGGFTMQLELRDGSLDYPKLAAITRHFVADAATQSGLALVSSDAMPPDLVGRYNLYPSMAVRGTAAPGFSSGEAMELMEQVAAHDLPRGIGYDWTGMSTQEKAVGGQIFAVFGLGILLVYLVLAGQYRSFLAPLAVLLAVPPMLLGPLVALDFLGLEIDFFVQIGLLLLIALASRDARRIVAVARRRQGEGMAIIEAALDAALVCFRPTLMNSLAVLLAVMPLVLARGAGAAARFALGITVFSGTIGSLCVAGLIVPCLFVAVRKFEERSGTAGRSARRERQPAIRQAALEPSPQSGSGVAPVAP